MQSHGSFQEAQENECFNDLEGMGSGISSHWVEILPPMVAQKYKCFTVP
jgi:hypothetical protein